jgi:hypothetical protein
MAVAFMNQVMSTTHGKYLCERLQRQDVCMVSGGLLLLLITRRQKSQSDGSCLKSSLLGRQRLGGLRLETSQAKS